MWVRLPWKPRASPAWRLEVGKLDQLWYLKRKKWPQPRKPKKNLHGNWLVSLGNNCYDNSPSCQRRPQNTSSTSPSQECWRDMHPDRKKKTNGAQWWGHKEKWITQKWRNAISMASCMLFQPISEEDTSKATIMARIEIRSSHGWERHKYSLIAKCFHKLFAHSAFKMFISIQNYLIYFVSFLSVFPTGL